MSNNKQCHFEASTNTSSATICKWCGQEKWQHNTIMSNNKQSMKLYTEEQVRKAIKFAQKCEHDCGGVYFEYGIEDVLEDLTPIELPSDEEIREERLLQFPDSEYANRANDRLAFLCGAKFVMNKIQGGDK